MRFKRRETSRGARNHLRAIMNRVDRAKLNSEKGEHKEKRREGK